MKYSRILVLMMILSFFFTGACSQLWKQYSDSAKAFSDQKKTDKAIQYYTKAKEELQKDAAGTLSDAQNNYSLADLYFTGGQYKKAEPLYIEAKQVREKNPGKESPEYAASCYGLAALYLAMGQYEKAERLYLESKQVREKAPGKNSPEYATSCNGLANLYRAKGQYKIAEPLYLESKQIREKILGKKSPDYATSCNGLANLYIDIGQYEMAEPLYLEAKDIRETNPGKESPDYAASCNGLANLYRVKGQDKKAASLYLEAKQIRERMLGKEHPDYAASCYGLAVSYLDMGQYEKAELLFLESLQIREKALGKEHPDYASSCSSLGIVYANLVQYGKAESLYSEAKNIREKALGKGHPDYASSCNNLAVLYYNMVKYEKAEPLYIEAKNIREKTLGKEHFYYAISCNNLANLYLDIGQYEKAEPLYLEAKEIIEKQFGKEHPNYAAACNGLGSLNFELRHYEKAESLYLEALQLVKKSQGKKSPDYASGCNSLAELYFAMGQLEKAKPLYLEAKQIWGITLGKEHPAYALACNNLTRLYWNFGEYEKANDNCLESFHIQYKVIRKIFQFASESEQQSYLNKIADMEKYFLSFESSGYPASRQGLTYDVFLFSRNLILSYSQQLRQAIYNSGDTSLKNKYNAWIKTREELSSWYTKSIAERTEQVINLEDKSNALESDLTRLSADFKKQQQQQESGWKNIRQSLTSAEAAIEFVEFEYYNGRRWTDSILYIALLIRKDKPEPQLIRLFEKKQLDNLISHTGSQSIDDKINTLYTGNTSLYDLIWKPLEKYLNGVSRVYFAPSGNLFKISFAALPVNDKQALSDKYQLVQLNTTTTVTDNIQSFLTADDKIRLYGGVQYNADSAEIKNAVKQYSSGIENSRSLPGDLTRSDNWGYLPGTEKEVSEIEDLGRQKNFSVQFSSGIMATEESVKALSGVASPSVLHIATHGFFFPDPIAGKRDSISQKLESGGKAFKLSDNPFFRSGLIFAGANNAWQGNPVEGIEDGILTAYEVSNMYLPNTKLVVLSACETGLGDVQGNEGVYGLQRAFKMAGVQNLVMSLWRIRDRETSEFMQQFYKNLFDKQSVNDAFDNAQAIMKNKYRNEPYKWAAWILVK